ncbi:TatD DNase family protein [Nematocida sp. AWRm77]|nr:TatD DNase family protein [Nematocida sp. AWRm77]
MVYDIAVNITDRQYTRTEKRPNDIPSVIERAQREGVRMVFLGTTYQSSVESAAIAEAFGELATVGVHPLSSQTCTEEEIQSLQEIVRTQSIAGKAGSARQEIRELLGMRPSLAPQGPAIVGIGEVGLDYYRGAGFKEAQKRVFRSMLEMSRENTKLPFFFHYRDCQRDFLDVVDEYSVRGVVHSFTSSPEEMHVLVKKGYYIGINGLSINENHALSVIEEVPLDRLLLETDAPYCAVKRSTEYFKHAGSYLAQKRSWSADAGIKGRNEPVNLLQVVDIVAHIKNVSKEELVSITNKNFHTLSLDSALS